jgi:hypothetical protein
MFDHLQFQMLSRTPRVDHFEMIVFGHPLSESERHVRQRDLTKQLEKARSTQDKIMRNFELAILSAGEDAKGAAYSHIGAALDVAVEGRGREMAGWFSLCWPLTALLVRTSVGSDPATAVVLNVLLIGLAKCLKETKDEEMRAHAHLAFGAFRIMHALELARMSSEQYQSQYLQFAVREAEAIDVGTDNAFSMSGWVSRRMHELGLQHPGRS